MVQQVGFVNNANRAFGVSQQNPVLNNYQKFIK